MRGKKQKKTHPILFLGLTLSIMSLISCQGLDRSLEADSVLVNGKIITVDAKDRIVQAVAIKAGKIISVGTTKNIKRMAGPGTQVIDLKGLTATPGLIDSHLHFDGSTLLYVLDLNYPKVKKIPDMVELVKGKVTALNPGEWVVGAGWDEGKIEEHRYVYAKDIDAATPDNPGWFAPGMGHYGLANSYALKLANITKETPDPPGGKIDRYPDGTPTGILKETAMGLVTGLIPPLSKEQTKDGIIKLIEEFNKNGMTAAKDGGIDLSKWNLYQELLAQNKLDVRMFVLWFGGQTLDGVQKVADRVGPFTKPYLSTGDDRLISGGIKLWFDGSGGGRTAWVYKEWNVNFKDVDTGNYGFTAIEPEAFRKMVKVCHDLGLHVAVHAIGDRAIDWTLDTFDQVLRENPIRGLRHSVIHCNIPTDRAIEVMAEMQRNYDAGIPELQAPFMWDIGDTYAGNFGPERCLRFMPLKTYLEKKIIWGGGSDWNVTPFEAKYGIWASMTRRPMIGTYGSHPYGTEQGVDVRSALRSYTIWNARQLFLEDKIGSIEVGKYADIAVWDKDLYSIPADEIKEMECQLTLVEGKIVYTHPNTRIIVSPKS
jgi:predicted amidohydrolase YtcJ